MKMKMKMKKLALSALALALLSTAAQADTVTIDAITAAWSNPQGTPFNFNTFTTGSNPITYSARWGSDVGSGQSGYNFTGVAVPAGPFAAGSQFSLGTFQHVNEPIGTGTSITGITLTLDITFELNGAPPQHMLADVFVFSHNETPNDCSPQPTCANDIVTATTNVAASQTITIGNTDYTFGVTGFQVGGQTFTSFSSPEGGTNSAQLIGTFDTVQHIVPAPIVGAGLPGLLAMFGFGGWQWRRRKQVAA
jgi:hypothetical protein